MLELGLPLSKWDLSLSYIENWGLGLEPGYWQH